MQGGTAQPFELVAAREERAPHDGRIGSLAIGSWLALVKANVTYWSRVAPRVERELDRWRRRAASIPDATLRALALEKLDGEDFNAQVAATLATLAPRSTRGDAIEAIVALEVMYDYLDGLTERELEQPLRDGARLFDAFTDAVAAAAPPSSDYYEHQAEREDGGYLLDLSRTTSEAFARLPASGALAGVAAAAAARCAEGQVRVHAAARAETTELARWAHAHAPHELGWRPYVAGAVASVLAVHAQIAAAAVYGAAEAIEHAAALDDLYMLICAISTMLDSLVDYRRDVHSGDRPWLVELYGGDSRRLAGELGRTARMAIAATESLPDRGHHLMTLAGVIAYYTSSPEARLSPAREEIAALHRELRPLLAPALLVMRAWRLAKRVRRAPRSGR